MTGDKLAKRTNLSDMPFDLGPEASTDVLHDIIASTL